MKVITAADIAATGYREFVGALREGFRANVTTPVRHHHHTAPETILLLMPAWDANWTGLKTVTVKGDNAAIGLPTVQGQYLLIDNNTGSIVAVLDGTELTRRRTAAASALAADYLARLDATTLVLVGAGALAPHFVRAHASVRPIRKVLICNRTAPKAESLVHELRAEGFEADVGSLDEAVPQADIVCGITNSTVPLIKGALLKPGCHVDLAGAFTPAMRETDGDVVARASVYVDTRDGALAEAGDLLYAKAEGKFDFANVKGDLFDLCRSKLRGRQSAAEITLFKSCGTALEDLAAAVMIYKKATET
jgi:ornithine cyclodeaminase/alanine dehydrogenase-like protein (mu-crystallin family)